MNLRVVVKFLSILILILFLTSCTITPAIVQGPVLIEDNGQIDVHFCPQENCEQQLVNLLRSAEESIHCALYDIGLKSVQEILLEKSTTIEVSIVTDDEYLKKFNHHFVKADNSGLMHNKIVTMQ